jgi:hypothetical protein
MSVFLHACHFDHNMTIGKLQIRGHFRQLGKHVTDYHSFAKVKRKPRSTKTPFVGWLQQCPSEYVATMHKEIHVSLYVPVSVGGELPCQRALPTAGQPPYQYDTWPIMRP